MRQMQGVLWTKGTLLTPQHLQVQDRFLDDLLEFRTSSLVFRPWGFRTLDIDREALEGGALAVNSASGIFPDGLPFDVPSGDPAPPPRPLEGLWHPDQTSMTLYLALPERRPEGRNVSMERGTDDARFRAEVDLRRDENTGQAEKPIQVARKNLRILAEGDNLEGSSILPVARLVRADAKAQPELDTHFVPPVVDLEASEYLLSIARRLVELLTARSGGLSASRRERAGGLADFGASNVASFWLLYTVNSALPRFRHILEVKRGHPSDLFHAMLDLAGALSTFSSRVEPRDFPLYNHLDLGTSFSVLDEQVRELLESVVPAHHVTLPLRETEPSVHATALEREEYVTAPQIFLGLRAGGDQSEVLRRAPQLLKISAGDRVSQLVRQALPGLGIRHVPNPPGAVPIRTGHLYFEVERTGPEWDAIRRSRNLAAYVPSDFVDASLELIVILPD
jgi:type VI secretion system protein ImpJ